MRGKGGSYFVFSFFFNFFSFYRSTMTFSVFPSPVNSFLVFGFLSFFSAFFFLTYFFYHFLYIVLYLGL